MASREKKKILFYSENFCGDRTRGGLEQATFRIAKALKDTGEWDVYDAYRSNHEDSDKSIYREVIKLSRSDIRFEKALEDFIRRNNIDVIVNMSRFFRHKFIVKAAKKVNPDIKIVFMQHFAPGSERKKPTYSSGWHLLKLNPFNPLYWLRTTIYPLVKLPRNLNWRKVYRKVYDESDKVILLSDGYIESYKKTAGIKDESKFDSIPNIFDIEKDKIAEYTENKEKRVLILSRMDEIQKRISLALKIWKKVMTFEDLHDWHLDIVGSGHDISLEKRLAKRIGLTNYTFHDWSDRELFLRRSAILMMTSQYEGLPLSILEAQAYGCIPIAYDSFESLRDVVTDGKNGIVVEKISDIDAYAEKLSCLMRDENRRLELSRKGAEDADRFSSRNITEKWIKLLGTL